MANFERIMRSVSGVQRCRLSNLQLARRVGILLVVAATFCLIAGFVEGANDDGSCGALNGGSPCTESGNCCSQHNYCGLGKDYCGEGCQVEFSQVGACDADTPALPPGSTPRQCGRDAENKKCDNNLCCSRYGYCGKSGDHCYTTRGCQSQCRRTPGQITGIVFGALGGFAILCAITFGMLKLYRAHQRNKRINRASITPVHRLFPANAAEDKDTCVDIVLCHGFAIGDLEREVWKDTWLTRSEHEPVVCWPEVWLGRDPPEGIQGKARVFALEYDANISYDPQRKGYHTDVSEIAHNLLHSLFGERHKIGQSNAVVLIGHSFGGLVIKSLVLEAQSRALLKARNAYNREHAASCQNFVKNIRGIIFYAVPHSGAKNLKKYIETLPSWFNRRLLAHKSHSPHGRSLLFNIAEHSRDMEELSERFQTFLESADDDLSVFAFIEGLKMSEAVEKIVEDASAMRLAKKNFLTVGANHFEICRPRTTDDISYQQLLSVLKTIIDKASHSSRRTTEQFDMEIYHGSGQYSGSQSLVHPEGKNPAMSQKFTRLIKPKPNDDTLPL